MLVPAAAGVPTPDFQPFPRQHCKPFRPFLLKAHAFAAVVLHPETPQADAAPCKPNTHGCPALLGSYRRVWSM